ncbi:hypothetical protein Hanom_Chr02g00119411 [Helianthus anomalus]
MVDLKRKVLILGKSVIYRSKLSQYRRYYRYRYFEPISHHGTDNRYISDISVIYWDINYIVYSHNHNPNHEILTKPR